MSAETLHDLDALAPQHAVRDVAVVGEAQETAGRARRHGPSQTTFSPLVPLFTVSNLAAMGLQVRMSDLTVALRNRKSLALIFVWGWVLGPARLSAHQDPSLAEPYAAVVLHTSLAPCAPFLQQMVSKASGGMAFAGALIPLVAVGTVVLMPLMAPALIPGSTIDAWTLAKPLLLTIVLPLLVGAAIRLSHRHWGDRGLPGGEPALTALHAGNDRVVSHALRQGDARHGWQPCTALDDGLHDRDGTDHLSLRLWPEAGTMKRHGAGDGHTKHRGGAGGGSCHSERGSPVHSSNHRADVARRRPPGMHLLELLSDRLHRVVHDGCDGQSTGRRRNWTPHGARFIRAPNRSTHPSARSKT